MIFHHCEGVLDEEEVEEEYIEGKNTDDLCAQTVTGVRRFLERVKHETFMLLCLADLSAA